MLSTQHLDASWDSKKVRKVVEPYIREALGDLKIADDCNWYINPTGKFVIGGPDGDAGLTGRKIIVDTYGGAAPHGGGAFSGKDTTKVDRSAAYAARYLAKNVVAAKLADRCTIQLSYAIGVAQPLSVYVDLHGTGKVDEAKLEDALRKVMDLSPSGIRRHLDLNKPIYAKTVVLRPFRPQGRPRRVVLLGKDRSRQGAQGRGRGLSADAEPDRDEPQDRPSRATEAFFGRRHGKTLRPQQAAALESGLPRYRLDLTAGAGRSAQLCFEPMFRQSGWRSASAAASIFCTARIERAGDRLHRRRALRQRHGQDDDGACGEGRSPISGSMTTTPRGCSTGCRRPRSTASTCSIPIPGRRRSTGSGVSSARSISTASRAC